MEMIAIAITVGFKKLQTFSKALQEYISLTLKMLLTVFFGIFVQSILVLFTLKVTGEENGIPWLKRKCNDKECWGWSLNPYYLRSLKIYLYTGIVQIAFLDAINTAKVIQLFLQWRQFLWFTVSSGLVFIFLWKTILVLGKKKNISVFDGPVTTFWSHRPFSVAEDPPKLPGPFHFLEEHRK